MIFTAACVVCFEHMGTRRRSGEVRKTNQSDGICNCCAVHIFKIQHPKAIIPTVEECEVLIKATTGEIFKPIKGYPNYIVSNLGRVVNETTNRSLNPRPGTGGKLTLLLPTLTGGRKNVYIHRIVAQHFVPRFDRSRHIYFIDGDITNCKATNLTHTRTKRIDSND